MTRLWFPRRALASLLVYAGLVLGCVPAFCQTETSERAPGTASVEDAPLLLPPPVSGQPYPTEFAENTEQNYWRGGFTLSGGYSSNVTASANPVADENYSLWGNLGMDRETAQSHLVLDYSPGFTFYQHLSAYNQSNQNLIMTWQYRITPAISVNVHEEFQKTSNLFNQPNPLLAAPVSGSVPTIGVAVIAPLADQMNNGTYAQITYQAGASSLLGFSGSFGTLQYLNSAQSGGLSNSQSAGGSAFYTRCLRDKYYVGVNYQYQDFMSYQTNSPSTQTQTQTVLAFVSVYLKPRLSVSVSAGPQHYSATQVPLLTASAWRPSVAVSGAWQGERTTLAASFSQLASGAVGLNGLYHSTAVGASANWRIRRNWSTGIWASYANNQSVTPLFASSVGGNTFAGNVSARRTVGEHASIQLGYNWTNQSYHQIAAAPNFNNVFVSFNYGFIRPLQR